MSERPLLLKLLLRERHWQNYATFCAEYDKAAARIDPDLARSFPSRAQLHRWLTGSIRSLPYPDHCRVLEEMLPGWTAEQLFQPASNAKLFTTTAAMAMLGPDDRFATQVIAEGKLNHGILHGNLILRGGENVAALLDSAEDIVNEVAPDVLDSVRAEDARRERSENRWWRRKR